MSRGPGRVQAAIEMAMAERADDMLTIADLAAWCYPTANYVDKKHRVAIARAAELACRRTGWRRMTCQAPGGRSVYFNPRDIRSYGLARFRADFLQNSIPDSQLRAMVDGKAEPPRWLARDLSRLKPGGAYWRHVEINNADAEGRIDEAAEMRADLMAHVSRLLHS